ncbi:MAG TPA: glycosyltransferase family 9 protein [Thermodesulfobacteriota bacterium]|nr:glycosyltransferase family 9 protein [Thermodesulfobacteriota bacterium]
MNVDLVRKIDYWLGRPACWILTAAGRLLKPFARKTEGAPRKFLLVELSEMGSAILAFSTMKALQESFPGAGLFFLIFEKNRPSVDILKTIPPENVLVVSEKSPLRFLTGLFKVILRMRREKIDCVFDLELFARITALLTFLSGAPIRVGFHRFRMEGLYRGGLHTHLIQYNYQQHIAKSFLSFVKVLAYPAKDWPTMDEAIRDDELIKPVYRADESAKKNIRDKLKKFYPDLAEDQKLVLFNPSAGEIPIRAWPIENYIELARRVLEDPKNVIVLMGAGVDMAATSQVHQALAHERCIQFTGQTTFPELMDLFSIAHLLITNDSGPAHFASLTPIHNFVFFGPETPRLYRPLGENTHILYSDFPCSPCLTAYNHRNTPCQISKCLQVISVDEVHDQVKLCL